VNGDCQCDADKKFNDGKTACVPRCTISGTQWCKTTCCPTGSSETSTGVCTCDSTQQKLNDAKSACVNRCASGFTYYNTQCCPAGSTEVNGVCVCTNNQQYITGSVTSTSDTRVCSNRCTKSTFTYYTTKCCPPGSTEVNKQCVVSLPCTFFTNQSADSTPVYRCQPNAQWLWRLIVLCRQVYLQSRH
jgi:hypothetical protein